MPILSGLNRNHFPISTEGIFNPLKTRVSVFDGLPKASEIRFSLAAGSTACLAWLKKKRAGRV
jgi:hypothetical protein